jgi:hypothetical protein
MGATCGLQLSEARSAPAANHRQKPLFLWIADPLSEFAAALHVFLTISRGLLTRRIVRRRLIRSAVHLSVFGVSVRAGILAERAGLARPAVREHGPLMIRSSSQAILARRMPVSVEAFVLRLRIKRPTKLPIRNIARLKCAASGPRFRGTSIRVCSSVSLRSRSSSSSILRRSPTRSQRAHSQTTGPAMVGMHQPWTSQYDGAQLAVSSQEG